MTERAWCDTFHTLSGALTVIPVHPHFSQRREITWAVPGYEKQDHENLYDANALTTNPQSDGPFHRQLRGHTRKLAFHRFIRHTYRTPRKNWTPLVLCRAALIRSRSASAHAPVQRKYYATGSSATCTFCVGQRELACVAKPGGIPPGLAKNLALMRSW